MKFFKDCKTVEDVKKLYKKLCFENHPDLGGNTAIMQEINSEYKFAIAALLASDTENTADDINEGLNLSEQYMTAINAVIGLQGVNVELVGVWIWVTGNTYPHKAILKGAKFMFASAKKAWFFRTEENKVKNRKKLTLNQIKDKYGATTIKPKSQTAINY